MGKYIAWFEDVGKEDTALVGGKGANLGEMVQAGFPVPPGFILTVAAYNAFVEKNDLRTKIAHILGTIDFAENSQVEKASGSIKKLIHQGLLPEEIVGEVFTAYEKLGKRFEQPLVAVRSSATAEDLANASFAGQQETFLNVRGEANLLLAIKGVWTSLYDARAIFYRNENKVSEKHTSIAVPVQKMVESDVSGIMFSIDPVTNDKSKIIIEAIYGLGELIVQGEVTPDHYEVDKKSFTILSRKVSQQKVQLIKKGSENKKVSVAKSKQSLPKLSDIQIQNLAKLSLHLEQHYFFPQDSEWAIGKGILYLVQTRPVTTTSHEIQKEKVVSGKLLLSGDPASPGIASGPVTILNSPKEIGKIRQGDVLVAQQTSPDYVPAMKKAAAIVTEKGGRTSHAAIVSREMGIPAIVGAKNATSILKDGTVITVDGLKGEVREGGTAGIVTLPTETSSFIQTATKVYVNLGEPDLAEKTASRHVDGVGLLRAEFMIAAIGVHPRKLIDEGKSRIFIEQMSEGIASFAKSFSPRPVVYRASDLKTNEYRDLVGGKEYEPIEPNPLLGFRGAYRYIADHEVFHLELEAIKHVRNKHNLKNVWLMLPFVRTVQELEEVKKLIAAAGLYRSPSFKIWMMVEIPANVILLDKFIELGIDGVSIGSNDLTMLTLGTDRDNSGVAKEFNEQDDAMLWSYEHVIKTAHKYGITSSLCGQAASVYPSLLKHLVDFGITSVSVSPDAIDITREHIARFENERTK